MPIVFISSYFKSKFLLFLFKFIYFYLHYVFWSFYKPRSQDSTLSTVSSVAPSGITEGVGSLWTFLSSPLVVPSTCQEDVCHNGGTCHPVFLSRGMFSFHCDCPLHFTGRFCEQGNQSSFIFKKTYTEGIRELQPYCTHWQILAQTRNICIILFKNEFW